MASLITLLSKIVGEAFAQENLPGEFGRVTRSDRPDLADFQCNGAMAAAKASKCPPRDLAARIRSRLETHAAFEKVDIAGPGFINLTLSGPFLEDHMRFVSEQKRFGTALSGTGKTAVLDYGGPNIAKPMHVGHMRPGVVGECLKRLYDFCGYETISDVHLGDWGLPMGMLISEFALRYPDLPYFDPAFSGPYPDESPVTMKDLEELYPTVAAACKEDEDRMALARATTADLQNGRAGYLALWKHFKDVSVVGMKENFEALNVYFDLWKGEADVHDRIAPMVQRLREEGTAEESRGAIIVSVAREDDNKDVPPLILYKADGAVTYGTTDLATIEERVEAYAPEKIVYVIDQRQSLHCEQFFRAAERAGYTAGGTELVHVGFGTVNGPDGKPFKSRSGGVMKLQDLIETAREKALQRLDEAGLGQDFTPEDRAEIGRKVAIAAIKFADLQNQTFMDYVFDLDRLTRFEGRTGPYLLYQIVRIKSLLGKAQERGFSPGTTFSVSEKDKPLALILTEFADVIAQALKTHSPHGLCEHAYKVAQEFSTYYAACHILSEENDTLRASRLALCALTCRQLECLLDILGIESVERM